MKLKESTELNTQGDNELFPIKKKKTIKTYENKITGEKLEKEVEKDATEGIIANYTVQLFDKDTGELIEEAKTENLVQINYMKYPRYKAIADMFWSDKFVNCGTYWTSNLVSGGMMTLLNSKSSNTNNYYEDGIIIGNCKVDETYSGADLLRGSLNAAESTNLSYKYPSWQRHIVVDFATNAANGTFNKINLSSFDGQGAYSNQNSYGSINNTIYPTYLFNYITCNTKGWDQSSAKSTFENIGIKNKYEFLLSRRTNNQIEFSGQCIYVNYNNKLKPENCIFPISKDKVNCECFAYRGDVDTFICKNGPNSIRGVKIELNSVGDDIIITNMFNNLTLNTSGIPGNNPNIYAMLYWNDILNVVINTSSGNYLVKYSNEYKFISFISLDFMQYKGFIYLTTMDDKILVGTSSQNNYGNFDSDYKQTKLYDPDTKTYNSVNTFYSKCYGYNSYYGLIASIRPIPNEKDLFIVIRQDNCDNNSNSYEDVSLCTLSPIFSQVFLPKPITKTSQNTMKIQYDIEIKALFQ